MSTKQKIVIGVMSALHVSALLVGVLFTPLVSPVYVTFCLLFKSMNS